MKEHRKNIDVEDIGTRAGIGFGLALIALLLAYIAFFK